MRALTVLHRWFGVAFCLLFAMWFASGAVIARVRRLEQRVRQAATAHYVDPIPVDGTDEISILV